MNQSNAIELQILSNIWLWFDCIQQSNHDYSIVFDCVQLIWRSIERNQTQLNNHDRLRSIDLTFNWFDWLCLVLWIQGMSIENFDCWTNQTQSKPIIHIGRIDWTQSNWSIRQLKWLIGQSNPIEHLHVFLGWLVLIDLDWLRLIRLISSIEFDWFDRSVWLIWSISSIDSIDQFDWVRLVLLSIIEIFDCLSSIKFSFSAWGLKPER